MKLISHQQIKIIWSLLQNHFNISDEIMIKIFYTFKGIQNPVIPILFFDIHSSLDQNNQATRLMRSLSTIQISYILKYNLTRSRKIIIKNMNCFQCNFNSSEWNFKSIHYLDTSCMFRSWTKSLIILEETYGKNFENYLCEECKYMIGANPISSEEYIRYKDNRLLESYNSSV